MLNEVELLKQLVAIPSVSRDEEAAVSFLVGQMRALGLEAHVDEAGNAVGARSRPDEQGRVTHDIVLLGHIDTVPGNIPVAIEDGRLYGRGTVDAKGPLAAFTVAAARAQLPPGVRVIVVGAVEEEAATSRGARHVARVFRPDLCIIGEPSGWDSVTLGYKGRLLVDFTLRRPMAHSAGPERGPAVEAIAWYNRLMAFIDQYNGRHSRLFDQILPSIREMATHSDGLANRAALKLGLRLPPHFDVDGLTREMQRWAPDATIRCHGCEPAFQDKRSSPLARAFQRALLREGKRARFTLKTGTSDMNVVGPIWNCSIVAYGPGDSTLDHTAAEHFELPEYRRAIVVLQGVLEQL